MTATSQTPVADALDHLQIVESRLRSAVASRRAAQSGADDGLRGLYISENDVDHLLAGPVSGPKELGSLGERLPRLTRAFGLTPIDVELLLIALAPDLDSRYERLYGYLHDDVTRRRASIGLALEFAGAAAGTVTARRRLCPGGPLIDGGLLTVEETDRPFLTRSLRVPDRVALHLLGDNRPDASITHLLCPSHSTELDGSTLAQAISNGVRLCYLRQAAGGAGGTLAAAAFRSLSSSTIAVDLRRLQSGDNPADIALAISREARLVGAGVVAGPVEGLLDIDKTAIRHFAEIPWPVVLTGQRSWDPSWSRRVPLVVTLPSLTIAEREQAWRSQLNGDAPAGFNPSLLVGQFRLGPEQIARAADAARLQSHLSGDGVSMAHLRAGARSQNSAGLERLARRIEPGVGWHDLVLPPGVLTHLKELGASVRWRDLVRDEWRIGGSSSRGRGLTALFAGESGTGKTMAAEVLAGELGLDLYAIDLATVVDKYIGETEKNLDRIFVEAEHVNGLLLFDEADALFGKRSDVEDARDRYANIEIAYLLQRMENFDGIAILATNLRANLDEAFTRRLDAVVDFPMPDPALRRVLWESCLGNVAPRADDIDFDYFAHGFELSGGNIRNIAVGAAYLAADAGRPITMEDLVRATVREYRKLGRLCVESEFGRHFELVAEL